MPITVTELDPPEKDIFQPISIRLDICSLDELRALKTAVGLLPKPSPVQGIHEFLKAKLARYERVD